MSELRNRMIQDLKLAGLVEGTAREYLRAVRQLAAYYMTSPDRISERQVENYILYVRDELGIAKGTFYLYFENKNDLVDEVISRYTKEFINEVILPNKELPRIKDLSITILDYFNHNRICLEELRKNLLSANYCQSTTETIDSFAEMVQNLLNPQENYHISNWDAYTRVLLGMILDVCYKTIVENPNISRVEAEEMLGDILKRFFSCE
jgi:AcrR family transcriptional regulator